MSVQNPYNNFMQRQQKKPINNFKEKVVNSLNGKSTQKTVGTSANTVITTPPNNNVVNKPIVPQQPVQQRNSVPTPATNLAPSSNLDNQVNNVNNTLPITDVQNSVNNMQPNTPTSLPNADNSGVGIMSQEDISNSFKGANNPNSRAVNPDAIVPGTGGMTQSQYEAEVKRKQEAGIALDNPQAYEKYQKEQSYQQGALDIFNQQKEQAQKDWELKQQAMQQQIEETKKQFEQSRVDADNAYKQTANAMVDDRYNQMQDLNVSGTNRGIQYSPQQLGLENVANINHNKNLAEASNQRNELLNKLQIETNKVLGQINMGMLDANNQYNSSVNKLQTDYMTQLNNWNREDYKDDENKSYEQMMLEEKRKWEEEQKKQQQEWEAEQERKKQEWQEMMDKYDKEWQGGQNNNQNNWQSGENALDREHDKTMQAGRSSGGGYGGSGWKNYGRSGFTPWGRSGWQDWSGSNYENYDMSDGDYQDAYVKNVMDSSTDMYNAVDTGGINDINERADIYVNEIDDMIAQGKSLGMPQAKLDELQMKRDTALRQMYNKSYARDTNGAYKTGSTVYENRTPVRDDYKSRVMSSKTSDRRDYREKYNVEMSDSRTIGNRMLNDKNAKYDEKLAKKVKEQKKKTPSKVDKVKKSVSKEEVKKRQDKFTKPKETKVDKKATQKAKTKDDKFKKSVVDNKKKQKEDLSKRKKVKMTSIFSKKKK